MYDFDFGSGQNELVKEKKYNISINLNIRM